MAYLAGDHFFNSIYGVLAANPTTSSTAGHVSGDKLTPLSAGDVTTAVPGHPQRSSDDASPNWDFDIVPSLQHTYGGEDRIKRIGVLKGLVTTMLEEEEETINQLELINNLERLGLSYHFKPIIQSILSRIYSRDRTNDHQDLYAKALEFRLLRQHGYDITLDILDSFKDDVNGSFKTSLLKDAKGMLCLYEASYLQIKQDETNLELARKFTAKYLKKQQDENGFDDEATLCELVRHSLEIPIHWRMKRLEARWFVDIYEKSPTMNPILREFAKIDFNIAQNSYQHELKCVSRWWESTGLREEMNFARDILEENFLWNVGVVWKREQGYSRIMGTKAVVFITLLDDLYDTYANLDDLELFTSVVQRWDVDAVDELPGYMKRCFLGLHDFIHEAAYYALKAHGVNLVPFLVKTWADLCGAYLQEAKWYHSKYTPTFQEYLNNAWISVAAPLGLAHTYVFTTDSVKKDDLKAIYQYDNIIRSSAMIMRLANDLGESPVTDKLKSEDVPKAIECYMKEYKASEKEAREHIQLLVNEAWKEMNTYQISDTSMSENCKEIAVDMARTGHYMYHLGDGHDHQNSDMAHHIATLFFDPIPVFQS